MMSFNATSDSTATFRCSGVNDFANSRPRSSSCPKTRNPFRGVFHLGRIRAKKHRARGNLAADNREVHRHMVPLKPEAPRPGIRWFAEDREEIILRIAPPGGRVLFLDLENFFQAHDARSLDESLLAQTGVQEGQRQRTLFVRHQLIAQPFPLPRNKVPIQAFFIIKSEDRLRLLVRAQST